jgi:hypothetical protein
MYILGECGNDFNAVFEAYKIKSIHLSIRQVITRTTLEEDYFLNLKQI